MAPGTSYREIRLFVKLICTCSDSSTALYNGEEVVLVLIVIMGGVLYHSRMSVEHSLYCWLCNSCGSTQNWCPSTSGLDLWLFRQGHSPLYLLSSIASMQRSNYPTKLAFPTCTTFTRLSWPSASLAPLRPLLHLPLHPRMNRLAHPQPLLLPVLPRSPPRLQ